MKREWFSIGIHLGYVYEGSPIIVSDGTPRPEDTVQTYSQTARPGSRAPHVWLEENVSTLDLFGKEFVLPRFGTDAPAGTGSLPRQPRRKVPFKVVSVSNAEAAALYERALVLVRPDGQCAWRSGQ
ncbi:aromatic-ring hydroxylase C-terminal domain-containing protein [Cupriavidus basilensis]